MNSQATTYSSYLPILMVATAAAVTLSVLASYFLSIESSVLSRLALLGLVAFFVLAFTACWRAHPDSLFELDTVFLGFFGAYTLLPLALSMLAPDDYLLRLMGDPHDELTLIALTALALFGAAFGFLTPLGAVIARRLPALDKRWTGRHVALVGGGMIALGGLSLAAWVWNLGGSAIGSSVYVDIYLESSSRGIGILESGYHLVRVGICVLFVAGAARVVVNQQEPDGRRSTWVYYLSLVLFALFALFAFRFGRRRCVLELAVALVGLRHLYVRRISAKAFAGLALAGVACILIVGLARGRMQDGLNGMLSISIADLPWANLPALLFSEPQSVLFTAREVVELVPEGRDFQYGSSYVESFQILVPSFLAGERPESPGQWFAWQYNPKVADMGGGYAFSHIAEGYLNFGYPGVFLAYGVIGIFLRTLVDFRRTNPDSKSRALIYAAGMMGMIVLMRADFATFLKGSLVATYLPLIVVAFWAGWPRRSQTGL